MIDAPSAEVLRAELAELAAEAAAWCECDDDDDAREAARVERVLLGSTLIDLARPDTLSVPLVRGIAPVPDAWGDARLFVAIAQAAAGCARDGLEDGDEAAAWQYVGAARLALAIADRLDVPQAQTQAAAAAKRGEHRRALQRYAEAVRALGPMKAEARQAILARDFSRSEKTIERWHAEARAAGLL